LRQIAGLGQGVRIPSLAWQTSSTTERLVAHLRSHERKRSAPHVVVVSHSPTVRGADRDASTPRWLGKCETGVHVSLRARPRPAVAPLVMPCLRDRGDRRRERAAGDVEDRRPELDEVRRRPQRLGERVEVRRRSGPDMAVDAESQWPAENPSTARPSVPDGTSLAGTGRAMSLAPGRAGSGDR